ncbi:hypothetical protein ACFY8K_17075 [Streptomyces misionensis]|uniref:hypothetical protein n=1 Tax=Streptomyces misionensis TaxID=67331 RepID=UPI0036A03372
MADEDGTWSSGDKPNDDETSQANEAPQAEFHMELRDSLPGGKAVIGVEQDGSFIWIGSKEHITEQARDEFMEMLTRIVSEGLWVQNWPGR